MRIGGIILTVSCLLMQPLSVSDIRKLWSLKKASEDLIAFLVS